MTEIFESVMDVLGPDITGSVAATLELPVDVAHKALQSSVAALLSAIAVRSRESGFISTILGLIRDPENNVSDTLGLITEPAALLRNNTNSPTRQLGSRILSAVFGSNVVPISEVVGKNVGIDGAMIRSLLFAVLPTVLAVVAENTQMQSWDARDPGQALREHLHGLAEYLPSNFVGMLGGAATAPFAVSSHVGAGTLELPVGGEKSADPMVAAATVPPARSGPVLVLNREYTDAATKAAPARSTAKRPKDRPSRQGGTDKSEEPR